MVSLVGSGVKVPVQILQDMAAFDSFIQASIVPFSNESDTGSSITFVGMGTERLHVPLHRVMLQSGLLHGELLVGVRPACKDMGASWDNGLWGAHCSSCGGYAEHWVQSKPPGVWLYCAWAAVLVA